MVACERVSGAFRVFAALANRHRGQYRTTVEATARKRIFAPSNEERSLYQRPAHGLETKPEYGATLAWCSFALGLCGRLAGAGAGALCDGHRTRIRPAWSGGWARAFTHTRSSGHRQSQLRNRISIRWSAGPFAKSAQQVGAFQTRPH